MNAPLYLIGFGAGLASALLYASAASGQAVAIVLFYVAPLPILLAGLGWRHHAGLIATVVAALALALGVGPMAGLFHALAVGLPAWWLAYLALLARPAADGAPAEWYPVGRLVIWCVVIGATLVALSIPLIALSLDDYRAALKALFDRAFASLPNTPGLPEGENRDAIVRLMVVLLPIMAAALWTLSSIANLWLAARITRASGRLARPWPELAAIAYPRSTAPAFLAVSVLSFLPDLFGLVAELYASTLLVAFTLLGLAVVHVATRANAARGLILFGVYAMLLLQPWVGAFLAVLGVAEQTIGVRKRFGPPPPPGGPPPTATAPKP